MLYSSSVIGPVLFRWTGYMIFFKFCLLTIVLILFIAGGLKHDLLQFFGIRQIKSGKLHSTLSESGDIDTSGILSLTRHPWYLAAIIFIWISYQEMYVSTLIVNILLTGYLVIGTVLEEKKLIIELGDSYRDYQRKVSMFFPTKWILSKLSMVNKVDSTNTKKIRG